jgi:hypothetical protein
VKATYPFYVIRLLGGLLYLSGMLIMLEHRQDGRCRPRGAGRFPPPWRTPEARGPTHHGARKSPVTHASRPATS